MAKAMGSHAVTSSDAHKTGQLAKCKPGSLKPAGDGWKSRLFLTLDRGRNSKESSGDKTTDYYLPVLNAKPLELVIRPLGQITVPPISPLIFGLLPSVPEVAVHVCEKAIQSRCIAGSRPDDIMDCGFRRMIEWT